MKNIVIREKEFKDIEEYEKLITLAWHQTYRGIVSDELLNNLAKNESARIERRKNAFNQSTENSFLLEYKNKLVGVCRFGKCDIEPYTNAGQIIALYLLNGYKGMGFGKILFKKAVEELVKQGFSNMVIGCLVGNPSNKFYEHMGGKFICKHKIVILDEHLEENLYLFENISCYLD